MFFSAPFSYNILFLNTSFKRLITTWFLLPLIVSKSLSLTHLQPFQGHRLCLIHLSSSFALSMGSCLQLTLQSVCGMALQRKEESFKDVKEKEQWQLSWRQHNGLKSHQLWSKRGPRNSPAAHTRFPGICGSNGFSERNSVIRAQGEERKTAVMQRWWLHVLERVNTQHSSVTRTQQREAANLGRAVSFALHIFWVLTQRLEAACHAVFL